MKFKNILFPIKTEIKVKPLPVAKYLEDLIPETMISQKQFDRKVELEDNYACTEEEKEILKKSRRLENHYNTPVQIKDRGMFCKFCYSKIIIKENYYIDGYKVQPRFCPKCNFFEKNLKCLYCGKDIINSKYGGVFCEDCLNFINENMFKDAYKLKAKEIKEKGYRNEKPKKTLCFEKKCKKLIDKKENSWFCNHHWLEYQKIKKQINKKNNLSEKERERIKEDYFEKVNPKNIWHDYLGPAMKKAKKGDFVSGQKIIKNLLDTKKEIPEYPLYSAYIIIGDLYFFNKEYHKAIEYYKKEDKFDINRIFNARRLANDSIKGDEIIALSMRIQYIDKNSENGIYPLKIYIPNDFFDRNKKIIEQCAEKLLKKWEINNNKKILEMGNVHIRKQSAGTVYGESAGYNPYTDFLRFTEEKDVIEKKVDCYTLSKPNTQWYCNLLTQDYLEYQYLDSPKFLQFAKTIIDIAYKSENMARKKMGIKNRGEGWVSETELYYKIKKLFTNYNVLHNHKPKWLGQQHLDIFLPELKLAIEYQGAQHSRPVDFFGGESGYKETQRRDQRKNKLCKKNNIELIYVHQGDDLIDTIKLLKKYNKKSN